MIHNHEVPSSILGLATDLEAPVGKIQVLFYVLTSMEMRFLAKS